MNQNKSNYSTLKWIISIILSVGIGTFVMNILENTQVNVWTSRIIGAVVTVIVELIFYYFWLKKSEK